jgi:Ca2+-binding RTX toxin-like protein
MADEQRREAVQEFAKATGGAAPPAGQKVSGFKPSDDLIKLWWDHQQHVAMQGSDLGFQAKDTTLPVTGRLVTVDITAAGKGEDILDALGTLGLTNATAFGKRVSGQLPIDSIDELAKLAGIHAAMPAYATTSVGSVTSQGDAAMRAADARAQFAVSGTGITVGILSDSFDTGPGSYADDVASADLPAGISILADFANGSDEGRAMAQLVHDVAPGSSLAFHTAFNGIADFAQGIIDLKNAGAKVITDDVFYLAEPMFLHGTLAQTVDQVVSEGVAYLSSAGNFGVKSYEAPYRPAPTSAFPHALPFTYQSLHDFDASAATDVAQRFTVNNNESVWLTFQWADPFFSDTGVGAATDLDLLIFSETGNLQAASTTNNIGGDPVEIVFLRNTSGTTQAYDLVLGKFTGPDPTHIKYIDLSAGRFSEHHTFSGAAWGHASTDSAIAVGAAYYQQTPAFGTTPPVVELSSSVSGAPILFDTAGVRLATPLDPDRVDISAPDGADTTFFGSDSDGSGFPNFFGTSASAPHAAAVAALMLEANATLTPAQLYGALEQTAIDMDNPYTSGFDTGKDRATGSGLVDAFVAVGSITSGPTTVFPGTPGDDNYCGASGGDQAAGFVNDLMTGQGGNDCFSPKGGVDTVFGGPGTDALDYSATSVVFGAPPAGAVINLASGVSTDPWGNADFTLELENAQGTELGDWLVGTEADNNTLTGLGGADTAVGLAGNDTLDLGAGNDQGYGYAGNDTVLGGVGNDTAYGSEGTDSLTGGADNDLLVGGTDNDTAYGEAGNDLMFGEGGDDSLNGADGDDVADGGSGNDTIDLGPGNNFGFAGAGIDTVIGNSGQDVLFGQGDNDSLSGGDALDNLLGGAGNDTLDGGGAGDNILGEPGDDSLLGGGGNDVLDGGPGVDQLFGQAGSDTFVHRTGEGSGNSATPDVIADFQGAGGGGFPEDDFLFLDVLAGGATFAPAGGGLAADVWKLTDGAVTEYLKITGVTSLVLGVDYGFF